MLKSESWFNSWTVNGQSLGAQLRKARLDGRGVPFVEALSKHGKLARWYQTRDVMRWKRGPLVRSIQSRQSKAAALRNAVHKAEFDEHRAQIRSLEYTIKGLEAEVDMGVNHRRVLERKLKYYRSGPDELGLLPKGEILAMGRTTARLCGVYFLINENEIIYVGQSVNIAGRVGGHHKDKVFTHYTYVECPESHLNALEGLYIEKFDPPLNGRSNGNYDMRSYEYRNLLSQQQGA